MRNTFDQAKFLLFVTSCLLLTACGGGGSSSGGGAGNFAGTYGGVATVTLSAPGVAPETFTGSITFVVNPDGTVVFDPNTGFEGTGTISGNTITGSYPGSLVNTTGVTCTGVISVAATGSGNTFTGTIGPSQIVCNGVPVTFNGTFSASKTSKALLDASTLGEKSSQAVRRVIGQ